MKVFSAAHCRAGAAIIAATLFAGLAVATPAHAASSIDEALAAVEAVAPEVLSDVVALQQTADASTLVTGEIGESTVAIAADPSDGILIDSGAPVVIELPFAEQADQPVFTADGTVAIDNNNGTSTVPVVRTEGSVQVTTVLADAAAPRSFSYALTIPDGYQLTSTPDGGAAIVGADGEQLGAFDAPWALDANGESVPTRYELSGTTLTQIVEPNADTAFPVVADPNYKITTFYWSKQQVKDRYNNMQRIDQICTIIPLSWAASIMCGVPPALADAILQAYYQNKRIKAVFYNCGFNYCSYYKYYVVK